MRPTSPYAKPPPTASMLRQTRTVPIVFVIVADPVGSGFVESLPHPGRKRHRFYYYGSRRLSASGLSCLRRSLRP